MMQILNTGSLREEVTFQRPSGTVDEFGNPFTIYKERIRTYADIRELIGRSALEAGIPANKHAVKITLRGSIETQSISVKDRCIFRGGRIGAVESVIQRDRHGQIVDVLVYEDKVTT